MAGTILHCIPGMGGGGAERQLAYLARPLITLGWNVHVALVADGPNLSRLEQSGATVHRLTAAGSYDPRLGWQLLTLMRQVRPDLVQAWFVQMEVLAGTVARFERIPWILSERSSALAYPDTWKNRLRLRVGRTAAAIISNSQGGDDYWRTRGRPAGRRFVIPNAIPLDEIDAAPEALPQFAIDPTQRVIVSLARLHPEKNTERLFEACCRIVQRPDTIAIMCGDGPLRGPLLERIQARGLADRLLLPGHIEQVWSLLKRADVVLSANTFEGRPNAALEAMAMQRPLVVSDIPAHREILDESAAFWADAFDPESLAHAVFQALDDPAGAGLRAARAFDLARAWSVPAIALEYDRAYDGVLTETR